MNPSAFELSKGISDTIGRSRRRQRDLGALDKILAEALKSDDPAAAMAQILSQVSPERQPAALKVLEQQAKAISDRQKQEGTQKLAQTKLEEQRQFNEKKLKEQREFDKGKLEEKREFDKSKPALTPNEELNQIRANARQVTSNLLAPFRNAFGGLELASKDKRKELADQLKVIQAVMEQQIAEVSKRLGIKSFDVPDEEGQDEEIQGLIDELEGPKILTNEIAAAIFKEAGQGGLRGAARKKRAIELAKQRGY